MPAALKPAVGGYCTIITAMVAVALGTSIATGDLRFGGGAVMRAAQLVLVSTLA